MKKKWEVTVINEETHNEHTFYFSSEQQAKEFAKQRRLFFIVLVKEVK